MGVWLQLPGHSVSRCASYRHRLSAKVTRVQGRSDVRVGGKTTHDDFAVTRKPDGLSPILLHACAEGLALGTITIELRRPPEGLEEDAPPPEYDEESPGLRFELVDVYVTSVLASIEDDGPLETVTLSYAGVKWVWEGDEPSERSWPT